jgi:hypothetical protein
LVALPLRSNDHAFFNLDTLASVIVEPTASRVFAKSAFEYGHEPDDVGLLAAAQLAPTADNVNAVTTVNATASRDCTKRDVLIEVLTFFIWMTTFDLYCRSTTHGLALTSTRDQ